MSAAAHAQAEPPPASTDPGRLRERFDVPVSPPREAQLPELKAGAREEVPEAVKAIRVTLREIQVDGSTVFTPAQLREQTDTYLGREITGSDIFGLAQALTAFYRNAGYFLSLVIVPPQTLTDGRLTLRVIEGYVHEVYIEGDERVRKELAAIGEEIKSIRPLRAEVLERYLLIANEFPGTQLRSVLTPSDVPGAADLTLIAKIKNVEGFASIDNYGTRYLGPNQAMVGVSVNQLLGVNDQWRYIGVGTGDTEMAYHQLAYSQTLNHEGLKVGVTVSQARTQPGDSLKANNILGRSEGVSLSLGYPLLRTRNQSLLSRLVYDVTDIDGSSGGTSTTEDRIRAVRAGLSWLLLDRWDGQNTLELDVSQGVGGTTRTDPLKSRAGADGLFSKLTFDYTRVQPLSARWALTLGVLGQWTGDTPLLSSEQLALGGRRIGRAYESAELVGDRGLALRLEPRYQASSTLSWLPAYQLLGFYEIGEVTQVVVQSAGTPATQSLASAGIGARLFMAGNLTAQMEAVWPLTKPLASSTPDSGKSMRLLASLMVRF
ncbi:MAG: ShlB/FhaC/HecB family hemolysin secretion/activation protein [Hylemonella sp.]|nr:ShlB/FhaC/HecB family hemolysin secretion/activation protein [Hylemonella sp.]MDP1939018.1 ShlB/FhaC/HecB family hemolysin secretion/activation protein [Hylemonella sp.]